MGLAEVAAEGEGVKVLACDSTNIFSTHPGRSEALLATPILEWVMAQPNLVVATTFASNIARLKTLADAAKASGRRICLLGRAMRRMVSVGLESGVLREFPDTIGPDEAAKLRGARFCCCSPASERRAASALSRGRYLGLSLKEGDSFLSSKTIPGNERSVGRIMNALSEIGVEACDDDALPRLGAREPSRHRGHADILKPRIVVPMHGEHLHLREHVMLARAKGMAAEIAVNGAVLDLTGTTPKVVDHVETGRLYLDGNGLIGSMTASSRPDRMALNGRDRRVIVDEDDTPFPMPGRADGSGRARRAAPIWSARSKAISDLERADARTVRDDKLDEAIRKIARQVAMEQIGKKPEVTVIIIDGN